MLPRCEAVKTVEPEPEPETTKMPKNAARRQAVRAVRSCCGGRGVAAGAADAGDPERGPLEAQEPERSRTAERASRCSRCRRGSCRAGTGAKL